MYTVYYNDTLIHNGASPEQEVHLQNPKLKLADNSAGSFEFMLGPGNIGYSEIERMKGIIAVKKENNTIWTGRVLTETKNFWNQRSATAEGALAYLNDTTQELHYYGHSTLNAFLASLLANHNAKVAANRQIQLGMVTMNDPDETFKYETNYKSTWAEICDNCLNRIGGHIRIRYSGSSTTPILDYLGPYPNTSPQEINFGSNLLDFTRNWDLSNLVTVILPRGKQIDAENENGQKDYITISSVNNGSPYLMNTTAYNTFGRLEAVVDFSDIETPSVLKEVAQVYLQSLQFDEMTMNVSAIDLHHLTSSEVSFNLLDEVRCISKPHGLDKQFPITEIDIPLDQPEGVTYTMGVVTNNSASYNSISTANKFNKAIKNLTPVNAILDLAKTNATQILNQRTTGYVSIVERDEESQALVISDTPEWESATKYWKFDMNGLGYTKNGGQKYDLAITMDGTIVADFIKTGVLSDGLGINYWNLSTGEFSLANTASILDDNGDYTFINDIVNLARDVDVRRTGSENYFDGSSDFAQWRKAGGWVFDKENAQCAAKNSATMTDMLRPPAKCLKYSTVKGLKLCYSFEGVSGNDWGELAANNCIMISFCLVNSSDTIVAKFDRLFSLDTNWKRKYTVVDMVDNSFTRENGQSASYAGLYLDVRMYNKSTHQITVRHIKLERGSIPTDWNVSTTDQDTYAHSTATEAKQASMKYTDNQKKALDESLNQEGVLKRLTNNFRSKGIWLQGGQLYMNADYVRTGTLDAGIIKAGILTDRQHKNTWNMVTGYLETTNAYFKNAYVKGDVESGGYYKIKLSDGTIYGIKNGRTVGYIEPTATTTYIPTGAQWDGIQIQAQQCLRITSPHIAVAATHDVGVTATVGYTGSIQFDRVSRIVGHSDGTIDWYTGYVRLHFINGIFTAWDRQE